MSDATPTLHGLVVLTANLEGAGLDRDAVRGRLGDALVDETEGSLTAAWADAGDADAERDHLAAQGLAAGTDLFRLEVQPPVWLAAYRTVSTNMEEHGG
mgnify:CR=1 FL=1